MALGDTATPPQFYKFGEWMLDTQQASLSRAEGDPVALRKLVMDVLLLLLRRAPNLVSKEELLDEVWGRQSISDNVIPQVIKELRQTLGDSAQAPRYIETRPKQGYRILPPVAAMADPLPSEQTSALTPTTTATPNSATGVARIWRSTRAKLLLAALIVSGLSAVAYLVTPAVNQNPTSALAQAALSLNFPAAPELKTTTSFADAMILAEALLYRGELPALRKMLDQLRTRSLNHLDSAQLEVLSLRVAGRDYDALRKIDGLLEVFPQSLVLRVQQLELEPPWRAPTPEAQWREIRDRLPPERMALIDARIAGASGDHDQQERLARSALALAGEHAPMLHALAYGELAAALAKQGANDKALENFRLAESALQAQGYRRLALQMALNRAEIVRRVGGVVELETYLAPFDAELASTNDASLRAKLSQTRGILLGNAGHYEESLALLEAAAKMFIQLDDHVSASSALNATSAPLSNLGRVEQVAPRLSEAQRQAALGGHAQSEAAITGNFSLYYWRRGEVASAAQEMRKALRLFEAANQANDVAQAQHNLASMLRVAGKTAEVSVLREQSLRYMRARGLKSSLATRLLGRAEDRQSVGEFAGAQADLAEAIEIYIDQDDQISLKAANCIKGLWLLESDDHAAAEKLLDRQSLESAPTANQSACIALDARLLVDAGREQEAIQAVDRIQAQQVQAGRVLLSLQSQLLGAELRLDGQLQLDAASQTLQSLHTVATRTGNGSLERDAAIQRLRLLHRIGASESEIALARREAEAALERFPDRVSQLGFECLVAVMQPPALRDAAQKQCRERADQQQQQRLARRLLAG